MSDSECAISVADIKWARERIHGMVVETPLIHSPALSDAAMGTVLVKFEGAQHAGSFKFRGAFNRLVQLSTEERAAGVVGWSSGNHAQGLATAARLLGIRATIVMPADAPTVKVQNTRNLGAEIVLYDRRTESREDIARRLVAEQGAILVPSFDDLDIIAGQGTLALEMLDQADAQGHVIDQVLVPCGGGGLLAGVALALSAAANEIAVYSVEPEGFDDTMRSLASGRREKVAAGSHSICDALLAPEPGSVTFPINQQHVTSGVAVSDDEVRAAIAFAFRSLHLVVEPGGATALAALLARKIETQDRTSVVVLSGSNIDTDLFAEIILGRLA